MKVREAFSESFGPVPEGATCHMVMVYELSTQPRICKDGSGTQLVWILDEWRVSPFRQPLSVDISEQPADSFVGFFGSKYDDVINKEKRSELPIQENTF